MNPSIFCSVCGGAFRPFTRDCPLRCNTLVYETRRWRQYRRNLRYMLFTWDERKLMYCARRKAQYARNLYERGRVAFLIQYHKALEPRDPSALWVVPRGVD